MTHRVKGMSRILEITVAPATATIPPRTAIEKATIFIIVPRRFKARLQEGLSTDIRIESLK
jgi:hypothetical protein